MKAEIFKIDWPVVFAIVIPLPCDAPVSGAAPYMTIQRRDLFLGVSHLTLAALLGAEFALPAEAQAGAETPSKGGTVRIAVDEPTLLTSAFITTMNIGMVSSKILEGLVAYDLNLKPIPALARSWDVAADGLTVTFHLRSGVSWHDGAPFSAADVKFSLLEVWKKLHPFGRAVFANVTAVDTPDADTVVVHLSAPALYLFNYINTYGAQILPRHIYEGTDILKNPANVAPIGTGPFVFKEWVRGSHIQLERNARYWQENQPYLDGVIFRFIPDPSARTAALENNEIDVALGSLIPVSNLKRFADKSKYQINTDDGRFLASIFLAQFNVRRPYLQDRRLRQALLSAIDRNALARLVWQGYAKPAVGPVPSSVSQYHSTSLETYPFDLKKAEALLDEVGFTRGADGIRLKLTLDSGSASSLEETRAAEFIKQAWSRVGIALELRTLDTAGFLNRVFTENDYDVMISSLHALPDPTLGVQRLYWTKNIIKGAPWTNGSGYSNPELDQVMQEAAAEADPAKRKALIQTWQEIAQRDLPILDLVELTWTTVSTARYHKVTSQGDGLFAGLQDAYLLPQS